MRAKYFILLFFILYNACSSMAQAPDSLWKIWNDKAKPDTIRLKAIDDIIWDHYLYRRPDSAELLLKQQLKLAEKSKDKDWQSKVLNNMGTCYYFLGEHDKSIEVFEKGLKIDIALKNDEGAAGYLVNIGSIYRYKGDVKTATEYYRKALKYFDKTNDKKGKAYCYNNLAMIYEDQNEIEKAKEFYDKSLKLKKEIKDNPGIQNTLINIGLMYFHLENYNEALKFYNEVLKTDGVTEQSNTLSTVYHNIGSVYAKMSEPKFKAQDSAKLRYRKLTRLYLEKGYELRKMVSDKKGMTTSMANLSIVYLRDGEYQKAIQFAEQAYQLAQETGILENIRICAKALYDCYKETGNTGAALKYFEIHEELKDSLYNQENKKEVIRQEYEYTYEARKSKDSLQRAQEKVLDQERLDKKDAEIKAKKIQQYAMIGGMILTLIFAGFIYNRLRVIRRQKSIIEEQKKEVTQQKHIIEEKHKEITDSINYAERIQRSFLASNEMLNNYIPDHFVYFRPKDVVSGDFYWCAELKNGNFLVAAADSTGHGVPGAIMSILNISCLENAVKEGYDSPSEVLDHTRLGIIERLKKDGSKEGGKDGMDAVLVLFEPKENKIKFSMANNPLWILRENKIISFAPDKMPVGKHDQQEQPFSYHDFELKKGDLLYLFTDGFADQFGGDTSKTGGKKFKASRMKEMFLSIQYLEMTEQRVKINEVFEKWKGEMEQVDDVCIIGIRI